MSIELLTQNDDVVYIPVVLDGIKWSTERQGSPGSLTFEVAKDSTLNITEGNPVRLKKDGEEVFYGFVFTKKSSKDNTIAITAYDQLRYLKNKDTYVYTNIRADQLVQMLADDFFLNVGTLENMLYTIPSRVEENETLFDIIQNALDLTLTNKGELFVLFDDFGKISLKNISSMIVPIVIDEQTGQNYSYTSSIDSDTYNQIKLTYDNEDSGKREVYMAKDSSNINAWGVLQYFDTLEDDENGSAKADALLELYNKKTRTLSISGAVGDVRVRAGSMVVVQLTLDDVKLNNLMLVDSCTHTFLQNEHFMDLKLKGGEFVV